MTRTGWLIVPVALVASGLWCPARANAQEAATLSGSWSLNRELSQFPREIGFNADFMAGVANSPDSSAAGGRERGGGSSGGATRQAFSPRLESREDAERLKALTSEVREPSPSLTITETPTEVAIAMADGSSRTVHPAAREEVLAIQNLSVVATARREAGRLIVIYKVETGRELRYTYSRIASPPQLVVDTQFVERGGGDTVRRIYEPARATEERAVAPAPGALTRPATPAPGALARSAAQQPADRAAAPADRSAAQDYDRRPDAALIGLSTLGVVVEGLTGQAAACGIKQDTLESAVVKQLTAAGFKVAINVDEDSYVYVNVMTTSLPSGLCVSRYDASVYTHTTAKLSYGTAPALVEVALLHKGGLAGGAAATHGDAVAKGVQEYLDQFVKRIRAAGK